MTSKLSSLMGHNFFNMIDKPHVVGTSCHLLPKQTVQLVEGIEEHITYLDVQTIRNLSARYNCSNTVSFLVQRLA